jgi:hypothetical protein
VNYSILVNFLRVSFGADPRGFSLSRSPLSFGYSAMDSEPSPGGKIDNH